MFGIIYFCTYFKNPDLSPRLFRVDLFDIDLNITQNNIIRTLVIYRLQILSVYLVYGKCSKSTNSLNKTQKQDISTLSKIDFYVVLFSVVET